MLNIYLGRENLNKEKFMYESIKAIGGRTYVIVPDQYTLEAERQAFRYMQTEVLLDTEIVSFSRLGSNLVNKYGRRNLSRIDQYGRHMILTKIFIEHEDEFRLLKMSDFELSNSLARLVNDFIADAKLANLVPSDFDELIENEELPEMLRDKLRDIRLIFEKYEEAAEDFTDAEDYIDIYTGLISKSDRLKNSQVWIYGFDSFTPKNVNVITALCQHAENVNVVLTDSKTSRDEDLFGISRVVTKILYDAANESGCAHKISWIGEEYVITDRPEGIKTLERELFALSKSKSENPEGITLVRCRDIYSEIESAASRVLNLLSKENLRYRDIVIICNGQSERLSIIKRTFEEHGIDIFDDSKRSIMNSPISVYIISLLNAVAQDYRTDDVLTLAKTGLTPLTEDEIEDLELYVKKYRIRNKAWKKPFKYGEYEYEAEGLAKLEESRRKLMSCFEPVESTCENAKTMKEFVEGCYNAILASPLLSEIENLITSQREEKLYEAAEESEQVWAKIVNAFDQIDALMGEQDFDLAMLIEILVSGLSQMEIGVIPPTADDVILGTMQRIRISDVKALIVIGANEGLLPMIEDEDALFSPEEASMLQEKLTFGNKAGVMSMEEKLAIYRNLSKPLGSLWISYSVADADGTEMIPSEIVQSIKKIFPRLEEIPDVVSSGGAEGLVGGKINTLRQMTRVLSSAKNGNKIFGEWKPVKDWILENYEYDMRRIKDGLYFDYREKPVSRETAKKLYQRGVLVGTENFAVSPSRLEKFSRCPFSHFVSYGLKPKEERMYEAGRREIGDLHHVVIAEFAAYLEENSLWNTITEEEAERKVRELMQENAQKYKEALFRYTSLDTYKLRRAVEVARESCWAMVEQYRAGKIRESFFEVGFGRNRPIKPVVVDTDGGKVYIEGKIDRLDILPDDKVKIIDYKSGNEAFDLDEVMSGYRLQLMLYLKAAEEEKCEPAGAFYFLVRDPLNDKTMDFSKKSRKSISEDFSKELKKIFKLDGIIVEDADTIRNIAGEFEDTSDVLSIYIKKDGSYASRKKNFLISPEDFGKLQSAFDQTIDNLCSALVSGDISIAPKKGKNKSPCEYCQYKSICRFDLHGGAAVEEE